MTSSATGKFVAAAPIGQHFGRHGTPNDRAWIESFLGHLKTEHPHLDTLARLATTDRYARIAETTWPARRRSARTYLSYTRPRRRELRV